MKLTFWLESKLQFVLINKTILCKLTSDTIYHDFRNCLVLFKPCTSQCTLILISQVNFKLGAHTSPLRVHAEYNYTVYCWRKSISILAIHVRNIVQWQWRLFKLRALHSKSIYDKEYTGNWVQQFWTVAMTVYNSRHVLCTAVLDSCHGICPENPLGKIYNFIDKLSRAHL